jgi:heme exporter protein CcmD
MDHTPFIFGAYAIGTVVLVWCAVAPLVRKKAVFKDIRRIRQIKERST